MEEEGVIKFDLRFTSGHPVPEDAITELIKWRNILWEHALIGQDTARYNGYGFGNVASESEHRMQLLEDVHSQSVAHRLATRNSSITIIMRASQPIMLIATRWWQRVPSGHHQSR